MEAALTYDGPPAEDLLAEYRRKWVEENLRDQTLGYEDGDVRGVDFGTVTQQIHTEELKTRLETYLRADSDTEMIDEVRVRIDDGTELCGDLTDDELSWQEVS